MTKGEQSVSAMIPKLMFGVSGAAETSCAPTQPRGIAVAKNPSAEVCAVLVKKSRRVVDVVACIVFVVHHQSSVSHAKFRNVEFFHLSRMNEGDESRSCRLMSSGNAIASQLVL